MRKFVLLVTAVALFIAGSAIGGSSIAGAAGSSASNANGAGSDDANTAVHIRRRGHRGPRGRRGRRGARGATGPAGPAGATGATGATGPQGPVGPPGNTGAGGTGGGGGVVPTEFRGNSGAPVTVLFNGQGMTVEIDCSSLNVARLRSQQENGFAAATYVNLDDNVNAGGTPTDSAIGAGQGRESSDNDFDNNDAVALSTPGDDDIYQGTFGYSGSGNQVVTGVYITSINSATAQGNCVFAGNLNRD